MSTLNTQPNMQNLDDFYAALLAVHEGQNAETTALINAKLILLLANHIGNLDVLHEALAAASKTTK